MLSSKVCSQWMTHHYQLNKDHEKHKIVKKDIRKLLKDLEQYNACDFNEISSWALKGCAETLDSSLEMLFRNSMKEGSLPVE